MIAQAVPHIGARKYSGALRTAVPVEADPADWAEQQQLVPLPDDEYPHLGGDRRVLVTAVSASTDRCGPPRPRAALGGADRVSGTHLHPAGSAGRWAGH